jgi:hypothetical protein
MRSCAQSRSHAGTCPGDVSSSAGARSPPGPISPGSCSARCRLAACAARGAASRAPTRPAPSPGNAFPSTSWVADRPRPLPDDSHRLELSGLVAGPLRLTLAEVQARDALGPCSTAPAASIRASAGVSVRLARLLERAGPLPAARREPRARDLPHRLPRGASTCATPAGCCWPPASGARRSRTSTARRRGWWRPAGADSSG